jgi:hypothetical protein
MAYKNPILNLADRYPVTMSILGFALFFELPARLIGMSYRQVKHGDFKLGNDLAGMPSDRAYAPPPDEGYYKGDLYRDTTHMNRYAASGPGGRSVGNDGGDPLYTDTRFKTPTKPTPEASESIFFDKAGATANRANHAGKIGNDASQTLVDMHTGSSVFAGLSGVNKLWGGFK